MFELKKLKDIRFRPCRNDPRIRHIATETSHSENKSLPTRAQATATALYTGQQM